MLPDQLPLFGFKDTRPRVRLKEIISKDKVLEGKKLFDQGRMKDSTAVMREIRYSLENYCKRINNGK